MTTERQTKYYDLSEHLQMVLTQMESLLTPSGPDRSNFFASMQYAMGWRDKEFRPVQGNGGKMLRPRLCLLACSAAGGDPYLVVPAAAAVELFHNFTLVHDDIQDQSAQRRHRASVWNLIGTPLAINTGDGMFVLSHLALHSLVHSNLESTIVIKSLEELDRAALLVCEGQHMDISFEQRDTVTPEEYLEMIDKKTGALMGLSCYLGALAAGITPGTAEMYRRFGATLGTAYQIRDDLAGIWMEEASTGKHPMEDIYRRKKSYPVVRAMQLADGSDAEQLRWIYAHENVSEEHAEWVRALMDQLKLHEEGIDRIRDCIFVALDSLQEAGASGTAADELRRQAHGLLL